MESKREHAAEQLELHKGARNPLCSRLLLMKLFVRCSLLYLLCVQLQLGLAGLLIRPCIFKRLCLLSARIRKLLKV